MTNNAFKMDMTGENLTFGPHQRRKATCQENEDEVKFFLKHLFEIVEQRDFIMSDPRLYMAEIPVKNELAYVSNTDLRHSVLGTYLEWWKTCLHAVVYDEKGNKALIYRFVGSPLTGVNHCDTISEDGTMRQCSIREFRKLWETFIQLNINIHATNAPSQMSLQEVYAQIQMR